MRCPCVILQYFHFCQACSTFSAAHMFMNEMPHPNIKLILSLGTSNCQYISAEDGSFRSPPPIHTGIFNDRYYTSILSLKHNCSVFMSVMGLSYLHESVLLQSSLTNGSYNLSNSSFMASGTSWN